jgi:periplasmic divalent cation tolerance protein
MNSFRLLYITVADHASGRALASWLVNERLAACAHLTAVGQSFFWWEGEVQEQTEMVVIAKTRSDLVEQAIAEIAARHAYDCPCILSLKIEEGFIPFLEWINQETRVKPPAT